MVSKSKLKIYSRYDVPPSEPMSFLYDIDKDSEDVIDYYYSRTKQEFANEADINTIINRYRRTGFYYDPLKGNSGVAPQFGDFTDVKSFHEAETIISQAYQAFDSLPASVRKEFNNDPAEMLDFVDDPSNKDRCIELGLILPSETEGLYPLDIQNGSKQLNISSAEPVNSDNVKKTTSSSENSPQTQS